MNMPVSMGTQLAALETRGLRHGFGGTTLFDDLDMAVPAGSAVALTGRNGAGKTTLLRILVGLMRPLHGVVLLAGTPLKDNSAWTRTFVAYVLDEGAFFPDLSVREHLDLFARAHGDAEPTDRIEDALTIFGIRDQADQLPVTLSSGQRRRLMLAACVVRPRRLLVLDEPEQRLDTAGRAGLISWLRAEKADGCAVVMATHDREFIDAVADDRLELNR
jgi:ABC-2 type transport system ATP-binding protein